MPDTKATRGPLTKQETATYGDAVTHSQRQTRCMFKFKHDGRISLSLSLPLSLSLSFSPSLLWPSTYINCLDRNCNFTELAPAPPPSVNTEYQIDHCRWSIPMTAFHNRVYSVFGIHQTRYIMISIVGSSTWPTKWLSVSSLLASYSIDRPTDARSSREEKNMFRGHLCKETPGPGMGLAVERGNRRRERETQKKKE